MKRITRIFQLIYFSVSPCLCVPIKSCRDVACHVDSTICHPEELATKDLAYTHFMKPRLFALLRVTWREEFLCTLATLRSTDWQCKYTKSVPRLSSVLAFGVNPGGVCVKTCVSFVFTPEKLFSYSVIQINFSFVGGGIKATPIYINFFIYIGVNFLSPFRGVKK